MIRKDWFNYYLLFNCWLNSYKLLSCPKQKLFKWYAKQSSGILGNRRTHSVPLRKDRNGGDWKNTQSIEGSEQGNCQRLAGLLSCLLIPFLLYPLSVCLPKITKVVLESSLICLQKYHPKRIPIVLSLFPQELNKRILNHTILY